MLFLKAVSRLPLSILYVLADIIFVVAYYVAGYRKKVVNVNLTSSFPEKNPSEILDIRRKFYRHLADLIIETLYGLSIPEKELQKRFSVKNMEDLNDYYNNGLSIFVMSSHNNNWEWFTLITSLLAKAEPDGVYQRQSSEFTNNLLMKIRTRFGARLVEKKNALRDLLSRKNVTKIVGMISDQSPVYLEKKYWTTFLNQETAFYMGTEKIARKLNMPVFYGKVEKVRRGYYTVEFIKIDEPPFNPEPDFITRRFVQLLEQQIIEAPAYWLWSHKRWKMKREPGAS